MNSPERIHDNRPSPQLFNSPLECGLRMLFVLSAAAPQEPDLQRLISYDYLLLHSGDADPEQSNLHPPVPYRGSEWLIKRNFLMDGLNLMFARELIDKNLSITGITYSRNDLTDAFLSLLKSDYAKDLRAHATWVINEFSELSDQELQSYMSNNIGLWGAEFEQQSALRELELD